MGSQNHETCQEHKLTVAVEQEDKVDQVQRGQWIRAAILGANDGLLSTTSLMLGIGAAKEDRWSIVLSGIAGAVAGACSMAVGEYVSVSTQRDIQKKGTIQKSVADEEAPHELSSAMTVRKTPISSGISCSSPGRSPTIPTMRATSDKAKEERSNDGKDTWSTPEMKAIPEVESDDGHEMLPNPCMAAVASALAFLCGSLVPLLTAMLVMDDTIRVVMLPIVASIALAVFGAAGAHLGGSPVRASAVRVLVGGWIAMGVTYGLLKPFDRDDRAEKE